MEALKRSTLAVNSAQRWTWMPW